MSQSDPDAWEIQIVTGARYVACLQWIRFLRERFGDVYAAQYMRVIATFEIYMPGDKYRCFRCLKARHGECKTEPSDLFVGG